MYTIFVKLPNTRGRTFRKQSQSEKRSFRKSIKSEIIVCKLEKSKNSEKVKEKHGKSKENHFDLNQSRTKFKIIKTFKMTKNHEK